jgi:hypothetical protein
VDAAKSVSIPLPAIRRFMEETFAIQETIPVFKTRFRAELELVRFLYKLPPHDCAVAANVLTIPASVIASVVRDMRPLPAMALESYVDLSDDVVVIHTCLENPFGTNSFSVIYSPFVGKHRLRPDDDVAMHTLSVPALRRARAAVFDGTP